jgi:hypothetical protein
MSLRCVDVYVNVNVSIDFKPFRPTMAYASAAVFKSGIACKAHGKAKIPALGKKL